jgi:hypothetical protein
MGRAGGRAAAHIGGVPPLGGLGLIVALLIDFLYLVGGLVGAACGLPPMLD